MRAGVFAKSLAFCNNTLVSIVHCENPESVGVVRDRGPWISVGDCLEVATDCAQEIAGLSFYSSDTAPGRE